MIDITLDTNADAPTARVKGHRSASGDVRVVLTLRGYPNGVVDAAMSVEHAERAAMELLSAVAAARKPKREIGGET